MNRYGRLATAVLLVALGAATAFGQDPAEGLPARQDPARESRGVQVAKFLAGGIAGLVAHETGHLLTDGLAGAHVQVRAVDFHGIPFFAITHRPVSPRWDSIIASAGFWVQHAGSEWLLQSGPGGAPTASRFGRGVLAFNVLCSVAYSGAALARTGPAERDSRTLAAGLGVDERWVGVMVLAPAVLDTYRCVHPDAAWARWASRGIKVAMVLLVLR
jgi:hypothetical protein